MSIEIIPMVLTKEKRKRKRNSSKGKEGKRMRLWLITLWKRGGLVNG